MNKKLILSFVIITLSTINFSFAQETNNLTQKVEVLEYYGYLSSITNTHLEIGTRGIDSKSILFSVGILEQMKLYSNLDILDYLNYSLDIKESYESLLYAINDILYKANSYINIIETNLISFKIQKEECDLQKTIVDKNYVMALKDFDIQNMEKNLTKSLDFDRCSSESRINYNAQSKILYELNSYYKILEHKYNYYYSNKFDILENYPNTLYNLKK